MINNKLPNVIFLGGISTGKTSTINQLWGKGSNRRTVSEIVKGRGLMPFNVIELDSVLFSMPEIWIENKNNTDILSSADTVVFVLPAVSFGYQEEISFLATLISSNYIKPSAQIILAIAQIDKIYKNSKSVYSTIEQILSIEKLVHKTAESILQTQLNIDNIVSYSNINSCNITTLKECIWNNIIESYNNFTYDENLPTIVVSGKRGCGKSTTLNKLFGLDLPTNAATACTKYPRVIHIDYNYNNTKISFNLVDLPGIAESLSADIEYAQYYKKYLSQATIVLCLSQADTRAYKQDEDFYKRLISNQILTNKTSILVGINQVDLLYKTFDNPEGIDLNTINSDDTILHSKMSDVYDNVYKPLFKGFHTMLQPFSAHAEWNIDKLTDKIFTLLITK